MTFRPTLTCVCASLAPYVLYLDGPGSGGAAASPAAAIVGSLIFSSMRACMALRMPSKQSSSHGLACTGQSTLARPLKVSADGCGAR